MAVLAAAALLDELMGRNRNVAPNEKVKELNWEDPEYCKYFLVKFCPHDLFVNTRADLGACSKVHDEEVKKLFDQAKGHKKLYYQEEFIRFCTSMVSEVDRKIVKGKQRLALSGKGENSTLTPAQTQKNTEQINLLNERINGLVEEAEQAGNEGNVEQAQGLMKLCDQLKDERDNLKKMNENSHWNTTAELAVAQEKQMEVCEVCGAFLIVGDAQQRIDDHLMGKQHVGYARLKAAIEEIQSAIEVQRGDRRNNRTNSGSLAPATVVDEQQQQQQQQQRGRDSSRSGGGGGGGGGGGDRRRRDKTRERERDRSEHRIEREKDRDRKEKERNKDRERIEREKLRRDVMMRGKERDRRHRSDREPGGRCGGGGGGGGERDRSSRHSSHRR